MTGRDHKEQVQQLFVRNISLIRGFIMGIFPDLHQAEDILQETFLTVSHKAEDFRMDSDFVAWARAIAWRKAMENYRREKKTAGLLGQEALEAVAEAAPEVEVSLEPYRKVLAECLKKVAPKARTMLNLRYREGMRPPEIADAVSWTVGAVHVALARARKFLRECVKTKLAGAEG
jgi:RNA polymerase sigma-70 factor (ECF subfamily)